MKLSNVMLVKSIVCIVLGVGLVIMPVPLMALFGVALNPVGAITAQFLGAAFLVLAIYLFLARDVADPVAGRAIEVAVLVGDAAGFLVALMAQLSNQMNQLGWIIVALYLLLALGFGYLLVAKPVARMQPG